MRTSLSTRITVLLAGTTLLILGGGSLAMDWRIDRELESRLRQDLLTRAMALTSMTELEQDLPVQHAPLAPWLGVPGGDNRSYYEVRCGGTVIQRSTPPPPAAPPGWRRVGDSIPRFSTVQSGRRRLAAVQLGFEVGGLEPRAAPRTCRLLFEQDRRAFDQILLALDWILLLGPFMAATIALLAVPLVVRRGLRPMRDLFERMRGIGPNAPGRRLEPSGVRELDPLVARINEVLERMDEGLARERQFASGLAHETRTRLAELRTLTEVESRYPSGRPAVEVFGELGRIGRELEATVTALLLLTRLQSGIEQRHPQWLDAGPWLQRLLARQSGARTIRVQAEPGIRLHTDPALLEVVVGNLLGNACAYAPAGDTIGVRMDRHGLVIDNRAGLEPDDLPRLGQRFWRKHEPHEGHAGLGLALAHAAATALGLALAFELVAGRLHASIAWGDTIEPPAGA